MEAKPQDTQQQTGTPTTPEWSRRYGVRVPQSEEPDEDNPVREEEFLRLLKSSIKED